MTLENYELTKLYSPGGLANQLLINFTLSNARRFFPSRKALRNCHLPKGLIVSTEVVHLENEKFDTVILKVGITSSLGN